MSPADFHTWLNDAARRPLVMGILNITPDSFSDGGQFLEADAALARAGQMVADGADWIDVGAESTRPGAPRVGAAEQLARIGSLLGRLRQTVPVILSIDTTRAAVAEAALDADFDAINDVSAGRDDPAILDLACRRARPIILMHMQGEPATMQARPTYTDVTAEVMAFLLGRAAAARKAGIEPGNILLDPGIGFGKTAAHNLALLRDTAKLAALGHPLIVGSSRKGFIEKVTGESAESGRPFGTAATVAWAVAQGAAAVRVHDVNAMSQVVRMTRAIQIGGDPLAP